MSSSVDRITAANLANYESAYSVATYGDEARGLFPIEAALIDEFLPRPPASILDLGCGGGRTTIELASRGYQVTAIDLSAPLIEHARHRHPGIDFRLMDATALTFADRSFDAAMFSYNGIDVVYPLQSRMRCLTETYRVLKPGGVFIFSSHNAIGAMFSGGFFYLHGHWNAAKWLAQQVGNRILREWYWRYPDPGGDQHLYSGPPSRSVAQARAAGFEVLAVRGRAGQQDLRRLTRHEAHVHFVVRKPV